MSQQIIYFGKGNIIVTPSLNALLFKEVSDMYEIGNIMNSNSMHNVITQFSMPFYNYDEIKQFKLLLSKAYDLKSFEYKNIVFDFSNYNRVSVDGIFDQLNWVEQFIPHSISV